MSPRDRGGIFISYRRGETSAYAGRLSDRLRDHFGKGRVFMDVDSIGIGIDFTEAVMDAMSRCDILLALIGRDWLAVTDSGGRRRIDNPDDWVRIEIETALQRGIRIVPVLIDGAALPQGQDLPLSLQPLTHRQAFALSHNGFQSEVTQLIAAADQVVKRGTFRRWRSEDGMPSPAETGPETGPASGNEEEDYYPRREREQPSRADVGPVSGIAASNLIGQMLEYGPVSAVGKWRLELVADEGRKMTFHLSSSEEVHEIVIELSWKSTAIKVDDELVYPRDKIIRRSISPWPPVNQDTDILMDRGLFISVGLITLSSKLGSHVIISITRSFFSVPIKLSDLHLSIGLDNLSWARD